MKLVEILADTDLKVLQSKINSFIISKNLRSDELYDIKYNTAERFSEAMIIYERKYQNNV